MEVDLSTGIYHLVYIASEDFEPLRSGGNYKEALKNFTEKSVHTEDQGIVAGSSDNYIHDFVENGLLSTRSNTVFSTGPPVIISGMKL